MSLLKLFSTFVLLLLSLSKLQAEIHSPHAEVKLISELDSWNGSDPFHIGLHFVIEPDWHIYWKNPGDSGMALEAQWSHPDNLQIEGPLWPTPEKFPIQHLANYGYKDEVLLPFEVRSISDNGFTDDSIKIKLQADWLICKIDCLPAYGDFSVRIPVDHSSSVSDTAQKLFSQFLEQRPLYSDKIQAHFEDQQSHWLMQVSLPENILSSLATAEFFSDAQLTIVVADEQPLSFDNDGIQLKLNKDSNVSPQLSKLSGLLILKDEQGDRQAFEISASLQSSASASIWKLILFALIGGLILNLMPCVFPVLSLKILGFVQHAADSPQKIRQQGWLFSCGVWLSFLILGALLLALRSLGESIGWGFQLQSPYFVSFMALLFVLLGFNLLGFFEWGAGLQNLGAKWSGKSSSSSAFFDGILATVIATPCTAPFMGVALGAALSQSAIVSMLIFFFLGTGMLLPYLLLSYYPQALSVLPRPGPWMLRFKQLLAFPLLATSLWLLWVLSHQTGSLGLLLILCVILLMGFAIWLAQLNFRKVYKKLLLAIVILSCIFLPYKYLPLLSQIHQSSTASASESARWEAYTPQRFAELRAAGHAVFIDFTATWCITCQVNKATTLDTSELHQKLEEWNVYRLRADWTDRNAEIAAHLAELGRVSVPTYAFYPQGDDSNFILFPEILTLQRVLKEVEASLKIE